MGVAAPSPEAPGPPLYADADGRLSPDALAAIDEEVPPGAFWRLVALSDALSGFDNGQVKRLGELAAARPTSDSGASTASDASPPKSTSPTPPSGPLTLTTEN